MSILKTYIKLTYFKFLHFTTEVQIRGRYTLPGHERQANIRQNQSSSKRNQRNKLSLSLPSFFLRKHPSYSVLYNLLSPDI